MFGITGLVDSNGNQVVSYTYDSWGVPVSTPGTMAETIGELDPFRYRGYFYDEEMGWYYLKNRYYDPEDIVRHEYEHTKQLDQLGVVKYLLCIGFTFCV